MTIFCTNSLDIEDNRRQPSAMRLLPCVTSSQLDLWIAASSLLLRFDLNFILFFLIKLIVIAGSGDPEPSLSYVHLASSWETSNIALRLSPLASFLSPCVVY